jgi:hypothetical protein
MGVMCQLSFPAESECFSSQNKKKRTKIIDELVNIFENQA